MLDYDELLNIADTIKNNYPKDAKDLSDALDLVSLALDGIAVPVTNLSTYFMILKNVQLKYRCGRFNC